MLPCTLNTLVKLIIRLCGINSPQYHLDMVSTRGNPLRVTSPNPNTNPNPGYSVFIRGVRYTCMCILSLSTRRKCYLPTRCKEASVKDPIVITIQWPFLYYTDALYVWTYLGEHLLMRLKFRLV